MADSYDEFEIKENRGKMFKTKDTLIVKIILTFFCFFSQQIYALEDSSSALPILDVGTTIKYAVTSDRFETPPIHLRVGVLRFEDLRPEIECNMIFTVPLNRGFTQSFVDQLSQSNVFDEIKEVPKEVLKEYENRKLDKMLAKEIGDKLKVDALFCGRIEKFVISRQQRYYLSYAWTTNNKLKFIVLDVNSYSNLCSDEISFESGILRPPHFDVDVVGKSYIKTIKFINEKVQKRIIEDVASSDTRAFSLNTFVPNIVLKGNFGEEKNFLKAEQEEIKQESNNFASGVLIAEFLCGLAIYEIAMGGPRSGDMGLYPYIIYPIMAIPTWFIAKNIGKANAEKKITIKHKVFFEQ